MIDPSVNYQKRKKIIRRIMIYAVSTVLLGVCAWLILRNGNYSPELDPAERYRLLCDAFMLPGLFYIMFGLLVFVSSTGFFDIFVFSIGKAIRLMIPALKYDKERFYEYKVRKEEQGRVKGYSFLFIVGGAFSAVGVVFLVLFYKVY